MVCKPHSAVAASVAKQIGKDGRTQRDKRQQITTNLWSTHTWSFQWKFTLKRNSDGQRWKNEFCEREYKMKEKILYKISDDSIALRRKTYSQSKLPKIL